MVMKAVAQAGRKGSDVRSDCWVQIELRDTGGIEVNVKSKVQAMYGESIERLAKKMMKACKVPHAILNIEDYGAVPFVLMARIETALRRADANFGESYLPEMKSWSEYESTRTRFRRSRLYLPGNEPKFMLNAGLHKPDGVILDLEDSVPNAEKDAAAVLVRNALRQVNFYGAERMVRINQLPGGLDDIDYIAQHNTHVILIPKCESADHVRAVDDKVTDICGSSHSVLYMPILESAKGILHAYEIATAAKNIVALTIGLEDYTADIGTQRTAEGKESLWARSMVVNAARAAGIQPIDTVFSDVSDMDGLRRSVIEARSLGFDGKGCIHPRQIDVIHEAFAPDDVEIARARKIVLAFEEAEAKGLGVVSLGSKMIDPPVVKRALHTVDLAVATNKLKANWRDES